MADPSHMPADWLGKAIAAAVAAVVASLATWLTSRKLQKANIESLIVNAAGGLVDRLEKECARVTGECTALRGEVGDLREQHRQCESRLDDLEREKRELRDEIAKLMAAAPAATYGADHAAQGQRIGRAALNRQKGETE